MKYKSILAIIMVGLLTISMAGCGLNEDASVSDATTEVVESSENIEVTPATDETSSAESNESSSTTEEISNAESSETTLNTYDSMLDTSEMFSDRDLQQEADLTDAVYMNLGDDQSATITEEGVYVITGEVSNSTIIVEADDEDKVQLVLDGVSITNEDAPAIYVKSGDKVFVTTTDSDNVLQVTGDFIAEDDVNLDAVIYSKSDLVINGLGTLEIISKEGNGVTSKDDFKVTGGTLVITAKEDGIEANDSIRIYDGDITIVSDKDGLHSENGEDTSLGYIYIQNGNLNITAADDGIHGTSIVQIDGGSITISTCVEGIEATYVLINDGIIDIYSKDDGINATSLSDYDVIIEINGGDISIVMASGDTDAIDSNGDIYVNDGNFDLTCVSSFDADGTIFYNGGTVVINGEIVTDITSLEMGGKKNKK